MQFNEVISSPDFCLMRSHVPLCATTICYNNWRQVQDGCVCWKHRRVLRSKEERSLYAQRFDHFLAANSKKDVFLTVIGPLTYKLLKSLVAPPKPGKEEYNQSVLVLTQHFKPAPSEIIRKYCFNSCNMNWITCCWYMVM